jgi:hypothetical protein
MTALLAKAHKTSPFHDTDYFLARKLTELRHKRLRSA